MVTASDRYQRLCQRIDAATANRAPGRAKVTLLAVSKRQPIEKIRQFAGYGQRCFGENYLQEAEAKIAALAPLALEWHFVGRLQSNKTRQAAVLFDWIHSVDRMKIAQRLNDQRPEDAAPLNICIEVNISAERSKGGIAPDEVPGFIDMLNDYPRLKLRGLMALPAPETDTEQQRQTFRQLFDLFSSVERPDFDTLSLGTSGDFETAIAAGATMVRIGTALFGPRG